MRRRFRGLGALPGLDAVTGLAKTAGAALDQHDCKTAFDAFLGGHRIIGRHAREDVPSDAVIDARLKLAPAEMAFSSQCIELGRDRYRPEDGAGPEAKGDVTEATIKKLRQEGAVEF